jgi:hypothetical protein
MNQRHGLRVTVRLHGEVVSHDVFWRPWGSNGKPVAVGVTVPTPSGKALAQARWTSHDSVNIIPIEPSANRASIGKNTAWNWSNQAGVSVQLDLVPRIPARRTTTEAWGDVALFVLMLTLAVGVGQINYLLGHLIHDRPSEEGTFEPTPEFIARLLQKDFAGEQEGRPLVAQRPKPPMAAPSFYLPAGSDGDWRRTGGGQTAGNTVVRTPARAAEASSGQRPQPLPPIETEAVDAPKKLMAKRDTVDDPRALGDGDKPSVHIDHVNPVERFVGWGFRDWFDVQDGRQEVVDEMARQLMGARVKLAIDPEDPQALQVAAYYAYLAEHYDLCKSLYRHYIERYPGDPSGYNNLALVLKRTGEYAEEEALYRIGLTLDPDDVHIANNLAVNLGHQGRFAEAKQLLAHLAKVTPNDAYTDLHRAKIQASMGHPRRALRFLAAALDGASELDTLHHIEFRQDIRIDPAFSKLRQHPRFRRLLQKHYGLDAGPMLGMAKRTQAQHNG